MKLTNRKTIFVAVLVVLSVFALGAFADGKLRADDRSAPSVSSQQSTYHDLDVFAKIVEKIKENYVDQVDTHELIERAIDGMMGDLDPHSQYLSGLDYEDLMVSTRGEFGGLGIYISFRDDYPTVISPIDDTPAARAGIRGGDQIIEIEGKSTKGWRTDKAVGYLRGEPGTSVRFKVSRPGKKDAIDYQITREVINVKSVPYYGMFDKDVGYMKVSAFAKHTADEMETALDSLEKQGMKALVLDFRSNPGGLLQAATEVSELFLGKDKLIVYTKGRLPSSNRKYYSSNRNVHGGYPIIIMINGASASASEIFTGAMQDWDAAFVVGQRSFGKGTVQTVFALSDSEAIKLTTAKYYTPSGRSIHMDEKTRKADLAAERAHEAAGVDVGKTTDAKSDTSQSDEGSVEQKSQGEKKSGDEGATKKEKPVYYTSSGRIVYGGGGITPDLEFEPQEYTDLERRLERDGLGFSFAVEYLTKHQISKDFTVDKSIMDAFFKFLDEKKFEYKKKELTDQNLSYIKTMLARELANDKFGRQAAYQVVTQADPEFQHVLKILKSATNLQALFQYAEQQKSIKKASND